MLGFKLIPASEIDPCSSLIRFPLKKFKKIFCIAFILAINIVLMVLVWWKRSYMLEHHYNDVIMGTMASQITSLSIVYSTVYTGADQRKHQSSASLAFVWGLHRGSANSPRKWPVTRKMFPFDDVIIYRTVDRYAVVENMAVPVTLMQFVMYRTNYLGLVTFISCVSYHIRISSQTSVDDNDRIACDEWRAKIWRNYCIMSSKHFLSKADFT